MQNVIFHVKLLPPTLIKMGLNLNSQGTKKVELFSQGTYNSQYLRLETLVIADYKYVKKPVLFYWKLSYG